MLLLAAASIVGGATRARADSEIVLDSWNGTVVSMPGHINAAEFDDGGEGVSYHDTTAGNLGGAYRNTDVDIEASSEGGYDVGWTAAGEWLNYTVNVATAGSYVAHVRVASPNGGSLHLGFNTASNVWASGSVPSTGGWQNWTTVDVPVTLGAGTQQITVMFDTDGINFESIDVEAGDASASGGSDGSGGSGNSGSGGSGSGSGGGATMIVAEWNIDEIEQNSSSHARGAIDYLMALSPRPSVIILAEAMQSHFSDYISELQDQTGSTWYGVFQQHCAPGGWTGSDCTSPQDEGVGIFTTFSIDSTDNTYFPYDDGWHSARGAVRAALNVNGAIVQVFGAHMSNDRSGRDVAIQMLKAWTQTYSMPQIVGGDFNADPDQIDAGGNMGSAFVESWSLVGSGLGYTCTTPDPNMHLDYIFTDPGQQAQPIWSFVNTDPGTFSDHFGVVTAFTIH